MSWQKVKTLVAGCAQRGGTLLSGPHCCPAEAAAWPGGAGEEACGRGRSQAVRAVTALCPGCWTSIGELGSGAGGACAPFQRHQLSSLLAKQHMAHGAGHPGALGPPGPFQLLTQHPQGPWAPSHPQSSGTPKPGSEESKQVKRGGHGLGWPGWSSDMPGRCHHQPLGTQGAGWGAGAGLAMLLMNESPDQLVE